MRLSLQSLLVLAALATSSFAADPPRSPSPPPSVSPSNPIPAENAHPGSTDWQLTRVRLDASGFRSPWIEGYCSRQSVAAGDTLDIMVSTNPPQSFVIEISSHRVLRSSRAPVT